jgi:hypothetical protein
MVCVFQNFLKCVEQYNSQRWYISAKLVKEFICQNLLKINFNEKTKSDVLLNICNEVYLLG